MRALSVVAVSVAAVGLVMGPLEVRGDEPSVTPTPAFDTGLQPFLENYCTMCHAGEASEGGLDLEIVTQQTLADDEGFDRQRAQWKSVLGRVSRGEMPPEGMEAPDDETKAAVAWLEERLARINCDGPPEPGFVAIRRLNRTEYRNTIHDLLGVDYDASETFPSDALGYGFDNIGDVLTLSPLLLEKYLDAAEDVSELAILAPEAIREPSTPAPSDKWEGGESFGKGNRALYSNGAINWSHRFSAGGQYLLRLTLSADAGGDEPARVVVSNDQNEIKELKVSAAPDEPQVCVVPMTATEGDQQISLAFVNDFYDPQYPDPDRRDRNLRLHGVEVVGPIDEQLKSAPASHQRLMEGAPEPEDWQCDDAWRADVASLLRDFLLHAYRRPPTDDEVQRLVEFIDAARQRGDSFERASQLALQAVLVSPQFLLRGWPLPEEASASDGGDATPRLVDQFELASRLSYFLWSSMPDDELLRLAAAGQLRGSLQQEVKRMLADDKATRLARNFGGQWLGTRELERVRPDPKQYPEFDDELREAMQREVELFLLEMIRHDMPITTLINADFTMVNERLARHYGIDGIEGENFVRVSLAEGVRGGVATMAGVLTVTSNPGRTSPVLRGRWLLGELLGDEPPPPPPGIPELETQGETAKDATLRELLEKHREDPSCAVCHVRMDPLGYSLENFDAIGQWRDEDRGRPIDSLGVLPDGREVNGARGLREVLMGEKDAFRRRIVEKMMVFALGRGLEHFDECAVRDVTSRLESHDDRITELVMGIVESTPFQYARSAPRPSP